jgi:hypothetical protein
MVSNNVAKATKDEKLRAGSIKEKPKERILTPISNNEDSMGMSK